MSIDEFVRDHAVDNRHAIEALKVLSTLGCMMDDEDRYFELYCRYAGVPISDKNKQEWLMEIRRSWDFHSDILAQAVWEYSHVRSNNFE